MNMPEEMNEFDDQKLEAMLSDSLKKAPEVSLPYGFAAMVTKKVFSGQVKPIGIKPYLMAVFISIIITAASLICLSVIQPDFAEKLLKLINSFKYLIGFILISFLIMQYIDQKLVRKKLFI